MSSTVSNWYHNQYATWNRMRRMQAPPFLARQETQTTRITRAASAGSGNAGDAVINMGELLSPPAVPVGDRKKQDTLFGPSIGVVNPGPDWADQKLAQGEKAQLQDVLTPELVKSWVQKSKEASQPTTTLQALVNLKRPTLRLSPISQDEPQDGMPQPQQHGFEFQYDCDAPKCGISLHVISSKAASSASLVDVYHAVVDGGFGRMLKLEEGATLELDKFDPLAQPSSTPTSPVAEKPTESEPPATASIPVSHTETVPHKKRFTLRIRKRTNPHANEDSNRVSVAGPALQVVDVESPPEGVSSQEKEAKDKSGGGVKILIKLEALDADGHTLVSPNSQATFLHIVRLGAAPASNVPDTRPWVVHVVKREATIGPHTFHLHEIYGLTSHAPLSGTQPHAYPPAAPEADDPTSECLLCLSSPREVVLLPCRHLVACKDCAVNMVEFGAGGQLVQPEEPAAADTNAAAVVPGETPGEGSGGSHGAENADAAPATAPAPAPAPAPPRANPRRKRKAKGWFCPVCRQPYTSLLRISTTALQKQLESEEEAPPAADPPVPPPPAAQNPSVPRSGQGFLRAISNAAARVTGSESNSNATEAARGPTVESRGGS